MTHFDPEKSGGDPVLLLCCGGEGPPLEPDVVVTGGEHCSIMVTLLAPMLGAAVFALEHRYYGKSHVVEDLGTENLRYLSSRQAIEDVAAFVQFALEEYKIEADGRKAKVVTFGGSYPGMIAGFSRLKYPHLISAAVASSAPVEATFNYQGYNDVVGKAIAEPLIGGSKMCLDAVKEAFTTVGEKLMSADFDSLASSFEVCGGGDALRAEANQRIFIEALGGAVFSQTNDPTCSSNNCNIDKMCVSMLSSPGTTIERLSAVARSVLLNNRSDASSLSSSSSSSSSCLDVDAKADRMQLLDTSIDNWGRVWYYQTCTEFAFYQTCDAGSGCPFTTSPHLITLESFTDDCVAAFNISASEVEENVRNTNIEYGGTSIAGTKILFPNGSVDPWYAAGMLRSRYDEPAMMVAGASHHAWTHPPKASDQTTVIAARKKIVSQVLDWVGQEEDHDDDAHDSITESVRS